MSEKPNFHLPLKRIKSSSSSEDDRIRASADNAQSECLDTAKESANTSELMGSISDLHEEISHLESQISKLRAQLNSKQTEVEVLHERNHREHETTSLLDARIDDLESDLAQAQQQKEAVTVQLEEARESERHLQLDLQNVMTEKNRLAENVEFQSKQIERYKTQIDKMVEMAARIEELEFKLAKNSNSRDEVKTLCDDQKVRMDELKQKIAELTTDNIEAVSARCVAENENKILKEQIENLTKEKLQYENQIFGKGEEMQPTLKGLNSGDEVSQLKQRVMQLETELSSKNSVSYRAALSKIEKLEEDLDIAEKTKANLQTRLEEALSKTFKDKTGEMNQLMQRFKTSEKVYCRLLKRCGIEIMSLRHRIHSLSDNGK